MIRGTENQIIAECVKAGGRVNSASDLAMMCGVSTLAVRNPIEDLELAGKVRTYPQGRSRVVEILARHH